MKFLNGPSSFLDGCHLNKGKAFGTLRVLVADNLGVPNLTYPFKQFEQITFRGIKGQVAHV